MKKRADLILVEKNLAENKSKAKAMIMAGQVSIDGKIVKKSGERFDENLIISTSSLNPQWVSRGALKLLHALEIFKIDVKDKICLDIGSSTGGFSQVLLKNNAKKIYSVDVGTNQLHEKLKNEKKIISLEKTNARYLSNKIISEKIDLIVCDVSFISMKKVLDQCANFLDKKKGIIIGLIKPQFEASKFEVKKRGVILDPNIHKRICDDFVFWLKSKLKMKIIGLTISPIKGQKGNSEFLISSKYDN